MGKSQLSVEETRKMFVYVCKKMEESKEMLEKALSGRPPLSEAHYRYALVLSGEEQVGEADYHFGMAAKLRGDYVAALRHLRRAQERFGSESLWSVRINAELRQMQ